MNIEDCSADIVILKNDFYRISLRAPSLTSLDEGTPTPTQSIPAIARVSPSSRASRARASTS